MVSQRYNNNSSGWLKKDFKVPKQVSRMYEHMLFNSPPSAQNSIKTT